MANHINNIPANWIEVLSVAYPDDDFPVVRYNAGVLIPVDHAIAGTLPGCMVSECYSSPQSMHNYSYFMDPDVLAAYA